IDGVEHQLDGHQHEDRVAAGEDSVQPGAEEEGGEHGGIGEVHQRASSRSGAPVGPPSTGAVARPLRERTIAPTRAASSRTESASKGSTQFRKRKEPVAFVEPWAGPSRSI